MAHAPARGVARVPLEPRFVGAADVVEVDGEVEKMGESCESTIGSRWAAARRRRGLSAARGGRRGT
jgi:hypothetical protein